MALTKLTKDGYGQIELNNVAFRRDGRIEAQCALATDVFSEEVPAENGMLLAVDNVTRTVKFAKDDKFPIALNYTAEHMYDERKPGLKNFKLVPGTFFPRLGYLSIGDKFTTNTVAYDTDEFTDEETLFKALAQDALKTTPVYGGICENGYIKLTKTAPVAGPKLLAIALTTMPDGQPAVKFQALGGAL